MQLVELWFVSNIVQGFEDNTFTLDVFLDLYKSFDTLIIIP